jgi:hypothetical protein
VFALTSQFPAHGWTEGLGGEAGTRPEARERRLVLGFGSDSRELHHCDADTVGWLAEAEPSVERLAMTTRIVTINALSILRLLPLLLLVLPAVTVAKSQDEATRSKDSLAALT